MLHRCASSLLPAPRGQLRALITRQSAATCRPPGMPKTVTVTLDGAMLRRGFWLYVWEITTPDGKEVLYVGRTGTTHRPTPSHSSTGSGRTLGRWQTPAWFGTTLRSGASIPLGVSSAWSATAPSSTRSPTKDFAAHKPIRDKVGAIEKKLAEDLVAVGYDVMNQVRWNTPLDPELYEPVRAAFAAEFPAL